MWYFTPNSYGALVLSTLELSLGLKYSTWSVLMFVPVHQLMQVCSAWPLPNSKIRDQFWIERGVAQISIVTEGPSLLRTCSGRFT